MAITEDNEALLLAYVYGELPASEARRFERRLDDDAELRAELEGVRATRALLERGEAWALRHGLDAPPPHLVDAIVRAEVLERAPEVRSAVHARADALAPRNTPTTTARLSRWLLGGGLLAGATATLVVTLKLPAELATPASPETRTGAQTAQGIAAETAAAAAAEAASPVGSLAKAYEEPAPAPWGAEEQPPARLAAAARGVSTSPPLPAPPAEVASPPQEDTTTGWASDADGHSHPEPKRGAFRKLEARDQAAPAAMGAALAAPDLKGGGAPEQSDSAGALARAKASARAELRSLAPSASAPAEAEAGPNAAATGPRADRVSRPSPGAAARARQTELASLALATGERELARRNFFDALDACVRAEELDPHHALGASPVWGQMRALLALNRPHEAVRVARRLLRRPLGEADVATALRLGAETAEQVGDRAASTALWTRLLEVPAERAGARAALERLARGASAGAHAPAEAAAPQE